MIKRAHLPIYGSKGTLLYGPQRLEPIAAEPQGTDAGRQRHCLTTLEEPGVKEWPHGFRVAPPQLAVGLSAHR